MRTEIWIDEEYASFPSWIGKLKHIPNVGDTVNFEGNRPYRVLRREWIHKGLKLYVEIVYPTKGEDSK